ncbi:methyltransferase type 12 [Shewanella sediminis HAW-EB3]|uniref:Methyltransferase type 12 n=1 Tax=Shewanella sediminis (strain HAW-EB3) TaxID=425104 RepID=A8FRG1_SHESH|nr:class I SAM-dependent methyltransferase [Shewanella sediminis]ABV35434.1 methyltransferase type 12 [Shewanella sediminis HAW-EB3]
MPEKKLKVEPEAAAELITHFAPLEPLPPSGEVLDLACGGGRNGLWFAQREHRLTFIDKSLDGLSSRSNKHRYLEWDLEDGTAPHLPQEQFDVVLVFNYLHRPLFSQIKTAVKPGGLIFYETFTEKQAEIGRPRNPDFLLKPLELRSKFDKWDCLHYFEGEVSTNNKQSFKAQLIARKPISQKL